MKLTHGVDEVYYKEFIVDEAVLRDFHKTLENAAQRFPAPAEIVFTIGTDDYRYFQTRRLEDVLHDLDVQKKRMVYLSMEAGFEDQNPRLKEDVLHEGRSDEWRIRVAFQIVPKGFWATRRDKVLLLVSSEDRKWASDYIDRFEEKIYNLPRPHRAPTLLFWLFMFPLLILGRSIYIHHANINGLLTTGWDFFLFAAAAITALGMTLAGLATSFFGYRPYIIRLFFGPDTAFLWGEAKADHEDREKFRHRVFWYVMLAFLATLFISMTFAMR